MAHADPCDGYSKDPPGYQRCENNSRSIPGYVETLRKEQQQYPGEFDFSGTIAPPPAGATQPQVTTQALATLPVQAMT